MQVLFVIVWWGFHYAYSLHCVHVVLPWEVGMGRLEPVNPYITGSILVYLCSYVCTYNTSLTSTCRCACVLLKLSNLIVQLCSVYVCVSGSVHLPFFTTETEELTVMVCLLNVVHFIQNWSVIIYAPFSRSLHKSSWNIETFILFLVPSCFSRPLLSSISMGTNPARVDWSLQLISTLWLLLHNDIHSSSINTCLQ